MNTSANPSGRLSSLVRLLREDLTEHRPGRVPQALQLGSLCLLVVFLSMTLRVPFIAISLIVLFYGVQSNAFFTRVVCVLFVVATVLDVGSLFLVLKYAYGYPLIRIVSASLILLGSMYLMRVNKLGLIFFAVALVVIYGQTTPDSLDFPELALRGVMWSVAAGLYPVLLMFLVCGYLFPSRPFAQLQQEIRRQLDETLAQLAQATGSPASSETLTLLSQERIEKDALALQNLHPFASQDDANYRAIGGYWQACIAAVGYVRAAVHAATTSGMALSDAGKSLLGALHAEIARLAAAVQRAEPYHSPWTPSESEHAAAVACRLDGVCFTLNELARFDPEQPTPKAPKGSLFVSDMKTNPAYLRFALKVLLASLICYVFYHGMQWDGIHTSLLTCVIVAYPSTGASFQKMFLRVGGATIGALLALSMSLLVIPHIDGIVALLCVLAPIFFAGAWIATGPERSSYIGTQFVFTFALAMLEDGFGPVTDLSEIRDRAVGILIGVAVSTVVYTLIWPESEAGALRQKLADALRASGKLLRRPETAGGSAHLAWLEQRMACWAAFGACDQTYERVALEINLSSEARHDVLEPAHDTLARCREILAQCDVLHNATAKLSGDGEEQVQWQAWQDGVAAVLDDYAEGLSADPLAAASAAPPEASLAQAWPSRISPSLAAEAQQLSRVVARLPDWTAPASLREPAGEQAKKSS